MFIIEDGNESFTNQKYDEKDTKNVEALMYISTMNGNEKNTLYGFQ